MCIRDSDFVEEQFASISGVVYEDTNDDDAGDVGIGGVVLTLVDGSGNPVDGDPSTPGVQPITTVTEDDGSYTFIDLRPGTYGVVESQPDGFDSVTDSDGGDLNEIRPITVVSGEQSTGHDFVEELFGAIAGSVEADIDNDDVADEPIAGVTLTLVDASGNPVDGDPSTEGVQPITTLTNSEGEYLFSDVPAGTYGVVETQPEGFIDVSDTDGGDLDEIRPILVSVGETNDGNDFLEEEPGAISGFILTDIDNNDTGDEPLSGIFVVLLLGNGNPVDSDPLTPGVQAITATTDENGFYIIEDIPPGDYGIVEIHPAGFASVSDIDGDDPDEIRPILVTAGEENEGNNFVEEEFGIITGSVLADTDNDNLGDSCLLYTSPSPRDS